MASRLEPPDEVTTARRWRAPAVAVGVAGSARHHRHLLVGSAWLVASRIGTALAGSIFWLVAAKRFSQTSVGEASGLFSVVLLLSFLTDFGLPVAVSRYCSRDDERAGVLFTVASATTVVTSFVGAVVLVSLFPGTIAGPLGNLGAVTAIVILGVVVSGFSVSVLVDMRLMGLRQRGWVLGRALVSGFARLPLLWLTPLASDGLWVWTVAAGSLALSGIVPFVVLRRRLGPIRLRPLPPETPDAARFAGVNMVGTLAVQAPFVLLPVIVLSAMSADDYAVFFIAWSIATTVAIIPRTISQTLLVEGGREGGSIRAQARVALGMAGGFGVVATVGGIILGPFLVVALYGQAYEESADLLPIFLASSIPWAILSVLLAVARIRRDNLTTVVSTSFFAAGVLLPALVLVDDEGAAGAGVAWLVGSVVGAIAAVACTWVTGRHAGPGDHAGPREEVSGTVADAVDSVDEIDDVEVVLFAHPAPDENRRSFALRAVVVVGSLGLATVGYLVAGPPGLLVAATGIAAVALGLSRAPAWLAVALLSVAGAATILEGELQVGLSFSRERPVAAAAGSLAGVAVLVASVCGGFVWRASTRVARPTNDRAAWRPSLDLVGGASVAVVLWLARSGSPLSNASSVVASNLQAGLGLVTGSRGATVLADGAPLAPMVAAFSPVGAVLSGAAAAAAAGAAAASIGRTWGRPFDGAALVAVAMAPTVLFGGDLAQILCVAGSAVALAAVVPGRLPMPIVAGVALGVATLASFEAWVTVAVVVWLLVRPGAVMSPGGHRVGRDAGVVLLSWAVVLSPWILGGGGGSMAWAWPSAWTTVAGGAWFAVAVALLAARPPGRWRSVASLRPSRSRSLQEARP